MGMGMGMWDRLRHMQRGGGAVEHATTSCADYSSFVTARVNAGLWARQGLHGGHHRLPIALLGW